MPPVGLAEWLLRRALALLVMILLWVGGQAAEAQSTFSGSVTNPEGEPLVGAAVTVRPLLDSALRLQVETDERGRFRLENFNPSRGYRFHVAKTGYRTEVRDVEAGLSGQSRDADLSQDFVLFPIGVNPTDRQSRTLVMTRSSAAVGPYQRGVRALERGDLEKARRRLEEARRLDPGLHPVHEALALVYHRQGDYQAALAAADEALAGSPWDPDYLRIRYEALVSLNRADEARQALDRLAQAAADRTTAVFFYRQGVDAWKAEQLDSAVNLLGTAIRLDPELLAAKDALAKVYLADRRYESALTMAAEVLDAEPGDLQLLRLRHEAWSALGRAEESRAALEELVRHDPGPRTATLIYNLGVREFNAGNLDAAEAQFARALELVPDQLDALAGMAEVRLGQGRYLECLSLVTRVLEIAPDHPGAQRTGERARQRMNP